MRITTKDNGATIKRTVLVSNGPILDQPYSTTGKKFRVERVTITYEFVDSTWIVGHATDVILGGPVLKKDGTASKVGHSSGADFTAWRNRRIELPWLVEIVNRLRPHGGSVLFHGEFEI